MTDENGTLAATTATPDQDVVMFSDFLETVPPSQLRKASKCFKHNVRPTHNSYYHVLVPAVHLHCPHKSCGGDRTFRSLTGTEEILSQTANGYQTVFLKYVCSDCRQSQKLYALAIEVTDWKSGVASCYKFGEMPDFGPPTSTHLFRLVKNDRDLFLRGLRSERQGLGIGAYAYYRRVVENQKNHIIDKIIAVSEQANASSEMINALKAARVETQFTKAISHVKDAIPPSLMIKGHNPLTLLHDTFSDGLHALTDEECLAKASQMRVLLAALSDRMAAMLEEDQELNDALTAIFRPKG